MVQILFEGKNYSPYPAKSLLIEDIVMLNGIVGWIDFVGADIIALVDECEITHIVSYLEMEDVLMLHPAFAFQESAGILRLSRVDWKEEKTRMQKEQKTSKERVLIAQKKDLTLKQISEVLKIELSKISKMDASHKYDTSDNLISGQKYISSTYNVIIK